MAVQRPRRNPTGFTDLIGERGVSKSDERIRAIGAVDEASAALGFARSVLQDCEHAGFLLTAQGHLSTLMASLAGYEPRELGQLPAEQVIAAALGVLEDQLKDLENQVPNPRHFVHSGSSPASGALGLARTVVRRAEREVVGLSVSQGPIAAVFLEYLNRLSLLCFLLDLAHSAR